MELIKTKSNNKTKKAITLVEMIIALSITTAIMVLLFSIVAKKATVIAESTTGTYYCWKDWDGNLYEKNPDEDIKKVSSCKAIIPRTAKNISVHIVGGGAGGYDASNSIKNKNYIKTNTITQNISCLAEIPVLKDFYINYNGIAKQCTKKCTSDDCTTQDELLLTKELINNDANLKARINDTSINSINKYNSFSCDSINLSKNFFHYLKQQGKCTIELRNTIYPIAFNKYILPSNCYFYSKGDEVDTNENVSIRKCANVGFCKDNGYNDIQLNTTKYSNELTVKFRSISISDSLCKKSYPGEYQVGAVEAGKEYKIAKDNIGNGGKAGANGTATKFLSFSAAGGIIKKCDGIESDDKNFEIKNSDELSSKDSRDICSIFGEENCRGSLNEQLVKQRDRTFIDVDTKTILDSSFKFENLDSTQKTGFGLFGASGPAENFNIIYNPVANISYNGYSYNNNEAAGITNSNNFKKGMGGAIIIRWE